MTSPLTVTLNIEQNYSLKDIVKNIKVPNKIIALVNDKYIQYYDYSILPINDLLYLNNENDGYTFTDGKNNFLVFGAANANMISESFNKIINSNRTNSILTSLTFLKYNNRSYQFDNIKLNYEFSIKY